MALTKLKIPQSDNESGVPDEDILELTDALPPHSDDFTSIADKAGRGEEVTSEDFESLKDSYIDQGFARSNKPSLLGRIATATRNLKNAALYKMTGPAAPASEAVIEHAPKQNLSERIANLTGKATGAVSATTVKIGTKTVDWTSRAAYQTRSGLETVIDASRYPRMKTYDGLHKAFVEKPVAIASGTTATAKGLWSSLKSGVSSAVMATASGTGKAKDFLLSRAHAVGQSLKDPETRQKTWESIKKATPEFLVQAAAGLPAGIAAKVLVTSSVGASFGTALAGGALASVIAGNVLKEYRKSKENEEKPELTGFFNKAAYLGKDIVKGIWFGTKHVAQGEVVWSLAREWKEDRNAILKRAAFGAVMGGIGWNIFGHEAASGIDTSHNDPTIIPDADADKVPFAPEAAHTAAPMPVHVLSVEDAQALKDQAVTEYWHGDKTKGLEMFREAAKAGNAQAIRDLAQLTGEQVGPQTVAAPAVVAPEPSLKLDLTDVNTQAEAELAQPSASSAFDEAFGAMQNVTGEDVAKTTAVGGGLVGAAIVGQGAVNALAPAMAAATMQPKSAQELQQEARIAQVMEMRAAGIPLVANNRVGLERGTCIISYSPPIAGEKEPTTSASCGYISPEDMQEGDFIRIIGENTNVETAAIMQDQPGIRKAPLTFVQERILSIRENFNALMSIVSKPAVVAQNDNQPTELAEAPKIAIGYNIK